MTIDQYHAFLDAEDQADHARWAIHSATPRNPEVTHEVTHAPPAAPSPRPGGESYRGHREGFFRA